MTPDNTRPSRGTNVIGKALGISGRHARRLIKKGVIEAHKLNGKTSPWIATAAEIERLRRGGKRD